MANTELKFRNYKPQTKLLEGHYTIEKSEPSTIHHRIQDKLELVNLEFDPDYLELKKPDWDLKCRIKSKLDKLERETNKQIKLEVKKRAKNSKT